MWEIAYFALFVCVCARARMYACFSDAVVAKIFSELFILLFIPSPTFVESLLCPKHCWAQKGEDTEGRPPGAR